MCSHSLVLAALAFFPVWPTIASAQSAVDVALVLVTDVSRSIDDSEFQIEKQGYATAFSDPRVIAAIKTGPAGRIAVSYVEFASTEQVHEIIHWTIISDEASAKAFTGEVTAAPRSAYGRTAIGNGIELATHLLADSAFAEGHRVIDVAGDGTSNAGRPVTEARDEAVEAGITINGLAIINDHPVSYTFAHVQPPGGLANWYRENVTGGPGSFVVEVHDFKTFGDAMARKLVNEIAGLPTFHG